MPFSVVATTVLSAPTHILDVKARTEYERDRKKAHKPLDIRKRFHSHHPSKTGPGANVKRTGLNWRTNSIDYDMMEDISTEDSLVEGAVFDDKENSRPAPKAVSVNLSELVRSSRKVPTTRPSMSRRSSSESLSALASLSIVPSTPVLRPITETDPLMSPMQPPSDFDSSDDSDFDDFDLDFPSEFSSPGADDWAMDESDDGQPRYSTAALSTSIVVEKSAW